MALFGRDPDENTSPRPAAPPLRQPAPAPASKTTLIASGATLIGEISGSTDVMIEGTVEGKVHPTQDVTVGDRGVVKGEIEARRVRIAGKVHGNVRGKESVEILATGSLEGDVSSPGMVIGDGAFFKGRVEMTGGRREEKPPAEPSRRVQPPTPSPLGGGGPKPEPASSAKELGRPSEAGKG
ncbi:MAG: polymer-forming cytoskeletal protein [Acidobacteriota bacterium]|nr:polymer-forming cytoskeletal protein [Acidobacteriota bacterium]MDH3524871.1 polymer-forming cytoskeletal protein [Acidobacteriota bacterium]